MSLWKKVAISSTSLNWIIPSQTNKVTIFRMRAVLVVLALCVVQSHSQATTDTFGDVLNTFLFTSFDSVRNTTLVSTQLGPYELKYPNRNTKSDLLGYYCCDSHPPPPCRCWRSALQTRSLSWTSALTRTPGATPSVGLRSLLMKRYVLSTQMYSASIVSLSFIICLVPYNSRSLLFVYLLIMKDIVKVWYSAV